MKLVCCNLIDKGFECCSANLVIVLFVVVGGELITCVDVIAGCSARACCVGLPVSAEVEYVSVVWERAERGLG